MMNLTIMSENCKEASTFFSYNVIIVVICSWNAKKSKKQTKKYSRLEAKAWQLKLPVESRVKYCSNY